MYRTFIFGSRLLVILGVEVEVLAHGVGVHVGLGQDLDRFELWIILLLLLLFENLWFKLVFDCRWTAPQRAFEFASKRSIRFTAAGGGNLGVLVFVIGVAGGAAGLLHLILDHRYHRMVGDAALTRTVVVQNVTEPKPALLH